MELTDKKSEEFNIKKTGVTLPDRLQVVGNNANYLNKVGTSHRQHSS